MKIEIWSDIACPFCYIGKRNFEKALSTLGHPKDIEVEWKSYQLNPHQQSQPGKKIHEYLAEIKGISIDQAMEMNTHVTGMAKEAGLDYAMDKIVLANTMDAHRLIQLAKKHKLGDQMEETLFNAYFTSGLDIADKAILIQLAINTGLQEDEVKKVLNGNQFTDEVESDIHEAAALGIRGVPFFVIDRQYGISGAQPAEMIAETLRNVIRETAQLN